MLSTQASQLAGSEEPQLLTLLYRFNSYNEELKGIANSLIISGNKLSSDLSDIQKESEPVKNPVDAIGNMINSLDDADKYTYSHRLHPSQLLLSSL